MIILSVYWLLIHSSEQYNYPFKTNFFFIFTIFLGEHQSVQCEWGQPLCDLPRKGIKRYNDNAKKYQWIYHIKGAMAQIDFWIFYIFIFLPSPSDRPRARCVQFPGGTFPLHLPVPSGNSPGPHGDGDLQHPGPVAPPQRPQSDPAGKHWA